MKQIIPVLIAALAIVAGCGRPDIEEAQRNWLQEQHRLETKLLEVRNDHTELRRRLDPSRADELADSASLERFTRATTMLREHESKLNAMDTMIDRHQLARDVAIRADDAAAVATGWAAAKVDYEASEAALEAIDKQLGDIAGVVGDIRYREAPDTLGSNRGVDDDATRAGAGDRDDKAARDADRTIDNKIGRDEPDEPGE